MTLPSVPFVCPICRVPVITGADEYACGACGRHYPVVLGIPDFRIAGDPWLSMEADRAKGMALESRTAGRSFAETVETYWQMTPDTPSARARQFIEHVLRAERRSREWLDAEALSSVHDPSPWIDLGCGTADLAAVLAQVRPVMAVDIAFRWLVVARRRLQQHGVDNVVLICADARALPLPAGSAGRVLSLGILEHVPDPGNVLQEAHRVLTPGGRVHLRGTNRFSMLPEPHVNVWGVGFVPRTFADRFVRWRGGEGYRHLRPLSAGELGRALERARFSDVVVRPGAALPSDVERLGRGAVLASAYNRWARLPVAGRALAWVAPLIEASGVAS